MGTAFLGARHTTALQSRVRRAALAAGVCSIGLAALAPWSASAATCGKGASGAERLSCRTIPEKDRSSDLIVHSKGPFVLADSVKVRGAAAEVVNADGLLKQGGGVAKLTTTAEHSTMLVVDLGKMSMGNVEIGVSSASGAPIRAAYAQFGKYLQVDGDGMGKSFGTDDDPESRVDVFNAPSGTAVLKSPGKRETRYVGITLDGPGTVSIDFVRNRQTIYPVKYDGSFLSSDRLLNRAWYASAYTGDLASLRQNGNPWMLTVTFDRVQFMGDLHMQGMAGYYQSSDYWKLMRNTLAQFPCVQNPDGSFPLASSPTVTCTPGKPGPPDGWRFPEEGPDPRVVLGNARRFSLYEDIKIDSFTAFWVSSLIDYYKFTGDAEFVRPLMPVARRAVGFLSNRTTSKGLYFEPKDDTPFRANWQPGDIATGVDSYSNAAFYDNLKGLALLEQDVAKRPAAARSYEKHAERVRKALIAHMWDDEAGAMILNDTDPRKDHSGDANAGNLMFRTLDPARAKSAMRFIDRKLTTPFGTTASEFTDSEYRNGAYIQGYVNSMEALGRVRNGDGAGAVDLVRRWWRHMLRNGPGTGWFVWKYDGSTERGDFANTAWTTALPALSEGLVGVRPAEAGFKSWTLAPQPSGLRWVQGRVPVPGGEIASRWRHANGAFVLTVEAPRRTTGTVSVPLLGKARPIAMDGRIVWRPGAGAVAGSGAKRVGDAVAIPNVRGDHTFAWGGRG